MILTTADQPNPEHRMEDSSVGFMAMFETP